MSRELGSNGGGSKRQGNEEPGEGEYTGFRTRPQTKKKIMLRRKEEVFFVSKRFT